MEASEINWQAYQQGFKAWDQYVKHQLSFRPHNPYQEDSNEWRSWNNGWNQNFNGITNQ